MTGFVVKGHILYNFTVFIYMYIDCFLIYEWLAKEHKAFVLYTNLILKAKLRPNIRIMLHCKELIPTIYLLNLLILILAFTNTITCCIL